MAGDELEEIPFDWIADGLRTGEIIPFLGAGASVFPQEIAAKPPSALSLARELARESKHPQFDVAETIAAQTDEAASERRFQARSDCANLALMSSWVEHVKGDRDILRQKLRQRLVNQQTPLAANELHRLVAHAAALSPLPIMTTNYDDLMEDALRGAGVGFDLFVVAIDRGPDSKDPQGEVLFRAAGETALKPVRPQDELLDIETTDDGVKLKRTVLFKIHGHVDRNRRADDTFVITEEDYVSFLGRMGEQDSLLPGDLMTLMPSRRLLFLGYGLKDWNLRVLLDRLTRMRGTRHKLRSYAVARGIGPGERELWDRRGVSVYNADLARCVQRLNDLLTLADTAISAA